MKVKTLNKTKSNNTEVVIKDEIFGIDPKKDVILRVLNWQLAKRQQGSHKVKSRSEVKSTTAKMYRQKGGGRARHGAASVVQFRGGGVVHGPVSRSHSHKLPKKIRSLALKMVLSSKLKDGKLKIMDDFKLSKPKTSILKNKLDKLKIDSALFIGSEETEKNFSVAVRNVPKIDFLPAVGINVYDILRRDILILSIDALNALNERFAK